MRRLLCIAAMALAAAGCDPNPFCLNCGTAPDGGPDLTGGNTGDDGGDDGGGVLPDLTNTNPTEGGMPEMGGGCTQAQLQVDPNNCGTCGNKCVYPNAAGLCMQGKCAMGSCQPGFVDIDKMPGNGCEYACIASNPPTEVCDGLDNDCSGKADEPFNLMTDVKNCGACNIGCAFPNGNGSCVGGKCTLAGCMTGFADVDKNAFNGCEYACPVQPPVAETCNGKDDDCNGVIDDNPKDVGQNCDTACPGPATCVGAGNCQYPLSQCNGKCCGICTIGKMICAGGQPACQAGTGPKLEICNNLDDNCDGQIDEGFNLNSDPNNCGSCGNKCNVGNAVASCVNGACSILTCKPGFANLDNNPSNGCEYTCPVNPVTAESCNGKDDDCDGIVDNKLTKPNNFCNQTSLCAGSQVTCGGTKGWVCNYQQVNANIEVDMNGNLALTEKLCDNLDGNCNTQVDESFPNKGQQCAAGIGACRGTATFVCSNDKLSTTCPAQADPNKAVDELCNGVDDNCDGQIDERTPKAGMNCYNGGQHACLGWVDKMVQVGSVWVHQYEASHPGATAQAIGNDTSRACSVGNVLPWAPVDWTQADAACKAIRNSAGQPMRLCTAAEWTLACNVGVTNTEVWSYATNPTTYSNTTCNGYDTNVGKPWTTGSGPSCYANNTNGRIYDMSGNVAEWTSTVVTANNKTYYKVRGGSYNNFSLGTNCNFDFTIEQPTYQFINLGFRCCSDAAP